MKPLVSRFLKFLGPHPYNPVSMFGFFWAFYASRFVMIMLAEPTGLPRLKAAGLIAILALFPAATIAGVAALWDRFRTWPQNRLSFYLLEIFVSIIPVNLAFTYASASPLFSSIRGFNLTTAPPNPVFWAFNFVIVVLVLAALNSRESKIRERLAQASELVATLEKQGRLLVLAESELKNQVSHFLHDRVQASLMVSSMRLKQISQSAAGDTKDEIQNVIRDLETLRMQDLRLAIESLSPNLEANELSNLIRGLIPATLATSKLTVEIPESANELSTELKLAIFKISEQAVLNSLIHGSAAFIEVLLHQTPEGNWHLIVQDDGKATQAEQSKPGLGSAIIDSWTRIIGGTKHIHVLDGQGYTLEISFPPAA